MTSRVHAVAPLAVRRSAAGGFSLLEVLVSLGIIAGALAGIAALLPAAGSRLADAADIDRAATMVANARADVVNRGLLRHQLWQQATGTTPNTRAIVFGEGVTIGGAAVSMTTATNTIALAGPAVVAQRIDPTTGFQLRDVVQTTLSGNVVITGNGYEPGICYGCMISSTAVPSGPGATVRLSTVVFRRPGAELKQFTLTRQGTSSVFMIGSGADVAADRRRFFSGCSWMLASSPAGGEPRWVQIASSWTAYAPGETTGAGTGASYVSLSSGTADWGALLSGGTLTAFGFDGLLRVDERWVNLE